MDTSDFKESYRMLNKIKELILSRDHDEAIKIIDSEREYIKSSLEKEGIDVNN